MSTVVVTLYSKPDCSLCDRLKDDLAWVGEQVPLTVEERNLLEDAETAQRLGSLIPVLEIDGALYYPPHDLLVLRRVIETAGRVATR
jgi:hypothetical protein